MICPICNKPYHTTAGQHHDYWADCDSPHLHSPLNVDFVYDNQDPMDGQLLEVNDKTHSAKILTYNEKHLIHTKKWWVSQ